MTSADTASAPAPQAAPQRQPSLAVTLLLILLVAMLWLLALQELCLFAPAHFRVYREMNLRLPDLTGWLDSVARWFTLYWYVAALAALAGLPVVIVITFWLRHGLRSPTLAWLWSLLLILPPLLMLEALGWAFFFPDCQVGQPRRTSEEGLSLAGEYLTPDGKLTALLRIRETEQSGAGPVGVAWVIETDGRWHIDPVEGGQEGLPRSQGQLNPAQLAALGRFLASQELLGLFSVQEVTENPQPTVVEVTFGLKKITCQGVRLRGVLRARPPEDEMQALEWSHLVAVIVYVDHLLHPDRDR